MICFRDYLHNFKQQSIALSNAVKISSKNVFALCLRLILLDSDHDLKWIFF